ncbi:MAG: four helix bundle suffix domain-containing protein [Prevotella sp.]|nr:four helix bundle suffix domain-containing protein [Prevotella sp.]
MKEHEYQILKRQRPWREAYYYQKSDTLYQLTYVFCQRFLPKHGDRTVDQMIQAARSGKQNIIEGTEAGETSTETHIKLLNVARSSLQELREDYRDYLQSHNLSIWSSEHNRYEKMTRFCKRHNQVEDYKPFFEKWTNEEMANTALTLCFMTDRMLNNQLKKLESDFVKQGGIKERMHAARTGYRNNQDAEIMRLEQENISLREENQHLRKLLKQHGIEY